jgi:hypothetical protein
MMPAWLKQNFRCTFAQFKTVGFTKKVWMLVWLLGWFKKAFSETTLMRRVLWWRNTCRQRLFVLIVSVIQCAVFLTIGHWKLIMYVLSSLDLNLSFNICNVTASKLGTFACNWVMKVSFLLGYLVVLNCWHHEEGDYTSNPHLYMVNFISSGTCSNSAVINLVYMYLGSWLHLQMCSKFYNCKTCVCLETCF